MATSETDGRRACDVNVMLALSPANHAHHKAATSWFEHVDAWAACPITGSACCRLLLNPRVTGFEAALWSGAGAQWLNPRVTGFEAALWSGAGAQWLNPRVTGFEAALRRSSTP